VMMWSQRPANVGREFRPNSENGPDISCR
jgi:hypothetical protein